MIKLSANQSANVIYAQNPSVASQQLKGSRAFRPTHTSPVQAHRLFLQFSNIRLLPPKKWTPAHPRHLSSRVTSSETSPDLPKWDKLLN